MVILVTLQTLGIVGKGNDSLWMLFSAGLVGASAMILPGLSGGYLLLLMGQYVPILSAIDEFKEALRARDLAAAMVPAWSVMLPVGLGVIAGVVVVGNLLQWLLHRYRKATLGVLLGLLLGSVVGLWPFQVIVAPAVGSTVKGQLVTAESLGSIDKEDWPTKFVRPTWGQASGSVALIVFGFGLTTGIARIGASKEAI
jgi:putative membrane protein